VKASRSAEHVIALCLFNAITIIVGLQIKVNKYIKFYAHFIILSPFFFLFLRTVEFKCKAASAPNDHRRSGVGSKGQHYRRSGYFILNVFAPQLVKPLLKKQITGV